MRPSVWIILLAMVAVGLVGCRPSTEIPPTPTLEPVSTFTPTAIPIAISPPTEAATATLRPSSAYAIAKEQPVNCRFGPGTFYAVVDILQPLQSALIVGKDSAGMWWYLKNPNFPGAYCWVIASATDLEGEAESIPMVEPPLVTVSKLEVRAQPERITVGCDTFPQFVLIVGQITTDGPTLVEWNWEDNSGRSIPGEALIFSEAGTQEVQTSLVITAPNDYWAKLHIQSPNEIVSQVSVVANCIP